MKLGQLIERLITKALMKDLIQKRGLVISSRYFDKNEKTRNCPLDVMFLNTYDCYDFIKIKSIFSFQHKAEDMQKLSKSLFNKTIKIYLYKIFSDIYLYKIFSEICLTILRHCKVKG